jgi:type I restriction enzyme M protein
MPRPDKADHLWLQLFCAPSSQKGRAGFIRANSASDARQSEQEIDEEFPHAGNT